MGRFDWPLKGKLLHTVSTGLRAYDLKIQGDGLMCSMDDLTIYVL